MANVLEGTEAWTTWGLVWGFGLGVWFEGEGEGG